MGSPSWSLRGARRLMRELCLSAADQTATSRVYQAGSAWANRRASTADRLGGCVDTAPPRRDRATGSGAKAAPAPRPLHRSAPSHHEPAVRTSLDRVDAVRA